MTTRLLPEKVPMRVLLRIDKSLETFEGWLVVVFLSCMVALAFMQVALRGLYTHGHMQWANTAMGYLDWSDTLVRLLILWLTFLGASLVTRENRHIKIDFFSQVLPPRLLPYRDLMLSVMCVFVSAVMIVVSIDYIKLEIDFGDTAFLGLPSWIGHIILPSGFASILLRFLIRGIRHSSDMFRSSPS
jgi:TRAP-type C4-dicarboxylate transport system permease small subunit